MRMNKQQKRKQHNMTTTNFTPMRAIGKPPDWSIEKWREHIEAQLPLMVQVKEDGIRCIINERQAPRSRTFKPIPNKWIQKTLRDLRLPAGFDGEIVTFTGGVLDNFNITSSKVMTIGGTPDFSYRVFDWFQLKDLKRAAVARYLDLQMWFETYISLPEYRDSPLRCVPNYIVSIEEELWLKVSILSLNSEGAMLKKLNAPYRYGKCTLAQSYVMKWKPMETSEALVMGFEEAMENTNPLLVGSDGQMERSHKLEGMKPKDTLGALVVRDLTTRVVFSVGTGFSEIDRSEIWRNRGKYEGAIITYTYQASRTKKEKPISPVWKGFRDKKDII